jgi:hypothetical protein
MKKTVVIIFLSVYFLGTVRPYIPLLNYLFNKEYIASKLCENKSKPMMHCLGKCHLAKELKKASGEESKIPVSIKIVSEDFTVLPGATESIQPFHSTLEKNLVFKYLEMSSFLGLSQIYYPPQA